MRYHNFLFRLVLRKKCV